MWKNLWDSVMSMYSDCPFLTGIALGAVACALASLLFLILSRLLCRMPRVSSFSYSVAQGRITVRAAAVNSLIFSLGKEFPELDVISAGLYRKKDLVFLKVAVDYRQGARPFPEVVSLFQQSVLEKLKDSFGIETVKEIEVCMRDTLDEQSEP